MWSTCKFHELSRSEFADSRRVHRRYKGIVTSWWRGLWEKILVQFNVHVSCWLCDLFNHFWSQQLLHLHRKNKLIGVMLGIHKLSIMAELSKMEVDCMGMGREENSKGWPSLVPRPFFYEGLGTRLRVVMIWWYGVKERGPQDGGRGNHVRTSYFSDAS